MLYAYRYVARYIAALLVTLALCACGGSPWRYDPGAPQAPSGVVAAAGDGKVTLNWSPATGAAGYNVYYSTSPGIGADSATKIANVSGSSTTIPGLANGTSYFFAVSSINANGESPLSEAVSAIPSPSGSFRQSDLQGTWRFNALASGTGAGWMRGTVVIDSIGRTEISSFLDHSGSSTAPVGLFGTLTMLPDGSVLQDGGAPGFHGALSANVHKDLLVATASAADGSRIMLILQKRVAGITFSAADLKGTGRLGAGPLPLVYHQLTSGAVSEWEHASCQVGQDQGMTYLSLDASTPRPLPGTGDKVATLSITADGIVSESPIAAALPQPAVLLTRGIMSADKMTIVATATDARGAHLLRVIQLVHPPAVSLTASSYTLAGLAGSYALHALSGGAAPLWGHGSLAVTGTGGASFGAFLDAAGSQTLPADTTLLLDRQGKLGQAVAPSYHGELSYFNDLLVATETDGAGAPRLSVALKR